MPETGRVISRAPGECSPAARRIKRFGHQPTIEIASISVKMQTPVQTAAPLSTARIEPNSRCSRIDARTVQRHQRDAQRQRSQIEPRKGILCWRMAAHHSPATSATVIPAIKPPILIASSDIPLSKYPTATPGQMVRESASPIRLIRRN